MGPKVKEYKLGDLVENFSYIRKPRLKGIIIKRLGFDKELDDLSFDEATINLATPSSIQFPHTHGSSTVLTYYINPEWKNEYYGETIFYDDTLNESIRAVLYKPNRAVLFSGKTPHSIRPASHVAPSYRFSLSIFYKEKNFIEKAKNIS